MKSLSRQILFALSLAATAAFFNAGGVHAGQNDLSVEHPRVRVTIPGRPAAGYMTIRNAGKATDTLMSASSPMAERIELHTHLMEGGIMKMREVEKVDVPASGEVAFSSGGHHLMIFGLKPEVKPGDALPVTLTFRDGGKVEVDFPVGKVGDPARPYEADAKAGEKPGHASHEHHKH